MQKPKEFELVLWEDITSELDGWQSISKIGASTLTLVFSIGWPVREDEHHLWIAMDMHDDEVNTTGKIPKSAIKARKKVSLRGFPPKVVE